MKAAATAAKDTRHQTERREAGARYILFLHSPPAGITSVENI